MYTFSGGRVGVANRRFNNLPHQYELSFDVGATIAQANDDEKISQQK